MSDESRRNPPFGSRKPRTQSQDERDMAGFEARKERDRGGVVKEFASDEITERYEGEELDERRATRPPDERFSHLETKHDELKRDVEKRHDELKRSVKDVRDELKDDVKDVRADVKKLTGEVGGLRTDVGGAVGKLDGQKEALTELIGLVKESTKQAAEREHVTFTAKVDVNKAHELAKVEVSRAEGLAKVEVTKEEGLDKVQAKKDHRATIAKIAGGILGGGSIVELLHKLGVL
jgi:gas vesicle protein